MNGEEEGEDERKRRGWKRGRGWRERVRRGEERRRTEGEMRSEEGRGGEGEEVLSEDSQRSSKISSCCTMVEAFPEPT